MNAPGTGASPPSEAESPGSIIRTARISRGISLRRFAERIGVSSGRLSDLETDRYAQPDPATLGKVAEALELDERELLESAGYPYLVQLPPDLAVYLRATHDLSDEALAHMKAQWAFTQEHYNVQPKDDTNTRQA